MSLQCCFYVQTGGFRVTEHNALVNTCFQMASRSMRLPQF